jgi:hypothetical protein
MVVVVEGGLQMFHLKKLALCFASDYLIVEVISFLRSVAFVDYGADGFD